MESVSEISCCWLLLLGADGGLALGYFIGACIGASRLFIPKADAQLALLEVHTQAINSKFK